MKFITTIVAAASLASVVSAIPAATTKREDLRLLKFDADSEPKSVTKAEKLEFMKSGTRFIDVTKTYKKGTKTQTQKISKVAAFDKPSHQDAVKPIIESLDVENMKTYLGALTDFNNRYYESETGAEASQWIVDTIQGIIDDSGEDASVKQFEHDFVESSIIATIPGSSDGPITILGAHMDSINLNDPEEGRAPGADDDGSGTVNLIEAFRALLASGFKPSTPVEFHFYAGEEGGLLGSQDIASSYASDGKEVKAMVEFDMTAYTPASKDVIGIIPDNTDDSLNTFIESLIDEYLSIGWEVSDPCGYACSDHASWYDQGFPTAMPFETTYGDDNPVIHSEDDTIDAEGFSWDHTLEYAKLSVAYVYELAI